MTAIVERVARKIYDELWRYPLGEGNNFDSLSSESQDRYRVTACAAILAMREPSEEVINAGEAAMTKSMPIADYNTQEIWQAMVDAALNEAL